MRRWIGEATVFGCLASVACHPSAPVEPAAEDEDAADREPTPLEPETPTNRTEGDALDVVVPLVDGGALELASLRGKVVLLEISASTEPGWDASLSEHAALAQAYGEHLRIVVVASDADMSALEDVALGPFELGWDPQGALAAKLRVAGFPTFLIVDPEGKISWIDRGYDERVRTRMREELERLLGS
jgi:hypothetical protein